MDFSAPGEITHEAARLEVQTERRFAVETPYGFSQGVIDRLVLIYRGDDLVAADIIDLKTDDVEPQGLHERVLQYRSQVSSYREAASLFLNLPIERISTRLVFVGSGQIVNVDVVEGYVASGAVGRRGSSVRQAPNSNKSSTKRRASGSGKRKLKPESAHASKETPKVPKPKLHIDPKPTQRTLWDD